ncbi:MAG: hypothetical protein GXP43_01425 [bacterium]|nr:hypothetical protein [bacterium]
MRAERGVVGVCNPKAGHGAAERVAKQLRAGEIPVVDFVDFLGRPGKVFDYWANKPGLTVLLLGGDGTNFSVVRRLAEYLQENSTDQEGGVFCCPLPLGTKNVWARVSGCLKKWQEAGGDVDGFIESLSDDDFGPLVQMKYEQPTNTKAKAAWYVDAWLPGIAISQIVLDTIEAARERYPNFYYPIGLSWGISRVLLTAPAGHFDYVSFQMQGVSYQALGVSVISPLVPGHGNINFPAAGQGHVLVYAPKTPRSSYLSLTALMLDLTFSQIIGRPAFPAGGVRYFTFGDGLFKVGIAGEHTVMIDSQERVKPATADGEIIWDSNLKQRHLQIAQA